MMKKKCNFVDGLAMILVIIGALNWGLIGVFHFNVIAAIFGELNLITRLIYIVVGIAGLWVIYSCSKCCKKTSCSTEG